MITQILAHDELPGIMAYFFSDKTVVLTDAQGRESKPQPFSEEDFTKLGWKPTTDETTALTNLARDLLFEAAKSLPPARKTPQS